MNYIDLIKYYYEQRGLLWPNFSDAMKFVITEVAEALELDLARTPYIRNNDKEEFSNERLSEELGDAIMMLLVAGMVSGVDPLESLENKIQFKLKSKNLPEYAPKSDLKSPNKLPDDLKPATVWTQATFLME